MPIESILPHDRTCESSTRAQGFPFDVPRGGLLQGDSGLRCSPGVLQGAQYALVAIFTQRVSHRVAFEGRLSPDDAPTPCTFADHCWVPLSGGDVPATIITYVKANAIGRCSQVPLICHYSHIGPTRTEPRGFQ